MILTGNGEAYAASQSMVRRMSAMARFIKENHETEFAAWWADNWPGKAEHSETLEFFANPELHKIVMVSRIVIV